MKHPNQFILPLFIFSVLFTASAFSNNSSLSALKEDTSLENIELKNFSPKVELHSNSHTLSLVESYLKSHEVSPALENEFISWKIKIPSTNSAPNLYLKSFENEPAAFQKFEKYPVYKEVIEDKLNSKKFLLDIIFSLQKHTDYKQIHTIFHPDDTICLDLLEKMLVNSLEFRVLSWKEPPLLKDAVTSKFVSRGSKIELSDSIISKQNKLLKPSFSLSNIFLTPLENVKLLKNSSERNFEIAREKTSPIILNPLLLPAIAFEEKIFYLYTPKLELQGLNVIAPSLLQWDLQKINREICSVVDPFNLPQIKENSLTFEKSNLKYSPKPTPLTKDEKGIFIPSLNLEKKTSPHTIAKLNRVIDTENESLVVAAIAKINKHLFIDLKFDTSNLTTFYPLERANIFKSNLYQNYYPDKENILTERDIPPIVNLNKTEKKYPFLKNEEIYSTKIDLVSKNYPFSFNKKTFDFQIYLEKRTLPFYSYQLIDNPFFKENSSGANFFATNENIAQKSYFEYPNLKPKNKSKGLLFQDPNNLTSDKSITLKSKAIGKLEKGIIKNGKALFFLSKFKDYEAVTELDFSDKIENPSIFKEKIFCALKQPFDLTSTPLLKDNTDKSLVQIKSELFYPFEASINKISYFDSSEQISPCLSPIKQIAGVGGSLSFELLAIEQTILDKRCNYTSTLPLKAEQTHLEDKLQLNEAEFKGNISLPKLFAINDKSSFFLNPMLLLIHSGSYDINTDITDSAYKVNQERRMTKNSLFNWPTLEDLQTDSLGEAFSIDTRLLSENDSKESEFAYTIKSYEKNILEPLPIHLLYILDTSKSIEPHRFKIFKEAIVKSIDHLEVDAKFNVAIVFKGKIELLHKESLLPSPASKGFTKRFLRKIEQSENITFADILNLIEKEKKQSPSDTTHRMCLLLSDGKFASNLRINREELSHLSNIESNNFSLYTASVSDNNNKGMLSFLAKLNQGFSLYTRTHTSFARKFCTLVTHLQHPIMHDITVTFPDESDSKIYLADKVSPILLADRGITLYGKNERKNGSRIFIQGKAGDRWINILKQLPHNAPLKARYNLKKNLASQKSFLSLYSFLKTKEEKYITEAKQQQEEFSLNLPLP
jgi:hypothetical protein